MNKRISLFGLLLCFILSSCSPYYDTIAFFCRYENTNNEPVFINKLYGRIKTGTDTGFMTDFDISLSNIESTEIIVSVPSKVYVETYEQEITIYSLGAFHNGSNPTGCIMYINIMQELDLELSYHVSIELNGIEKVVKTSVYISALNNEVKFTYDFN